MGLCEASRTWYVGRKGFSVLGSLTLPGKDQARRSTDVSLSVASMRAAVNEFVCAVIAEWGGVYDLRGCLIGESYDKGILLYGVYFWDPLFFVNPQMKSNI